MAFICQLCAGERVAVGLAVLGPARIPALRRGRHAADRLRVRDMKNLLALAIVCLSTAALAQEPRVVPDEPIGTPYNTNSSGSSVSLRDFLSARIDQNRADILDRVDSDVKTLRLLIDERDRLYNERSEARTKALEDTLAATKEAADKAAGELTKRFDSVNEFRQTLSDQAQTFAAKDSVEIRFKALEENINKNATELSAIQSRSAGATQLWTIIAAAIALIAVVGGFVLNFSRRTAR